MSVYSLRICAVSLPRVYLHFNKHSSVSRSGLDLALGVERGTHFPYLLSFLTFEPRSWCVCPLKPYFIKTVNSFLNCSP